MPDKPHRLETDLIHAGEPRPRIEGAVTLPIFQSSTFEFGANPTTTASAICDSATPPTMRLFTRSWRRWKGARRRW